MANLEDVIEQKIKDNRQIYNAMTKKFIDDKKEVATLVLQMSTSGHVKIIINKLVSMSCDIQAIESLNSNYYELLNMQH